MNALELKNVNKAFPEFQLKNLSFTLPSGCIMGLIGENGAGKSTTIRLILNMLHMDSGQITILGRDNGDNIVSLKEEIGVVTEGTGLPSCLTARQVGKVMKHSFRNWDEAEYTRLLEKFSIPDRKQIRWFSHGMWMKLKIAIAMSHGAKLLLLDEPTGGLDPVAREEVVEMFYDFTRDEHHSILISSHIVSDLEKLCDYVAFLHKGELLLCEEKDRLLSQYGIVHCTAEQVSSLHSVQYKKETPYGLEVILPREAVPEEFHISPINIEELFLLMIKEAK